MFNSLFLVKFSSFSSWKYPPKHHFPIFLLVVMFFGDNFSSFLLLKKKQHHHFHRKSQVTKSFPRLSKRCKQKWSPSWLASMQSGTLHCPLKRLLWNAGTKNRSKSSRQPCRQSAKSLDDSWKRDYIKILQKKIQQFAENNALGSAPTLREKEKQKAFPRFCKLQPNFNPIINL